MVGSSSYFCLAFSLAWTAISKLSLQKGEYFFLHPLGIVSDAAFRMAKLISSQMVSTFPDAYLKESEINTHTNLNRCR